MRFQPQHSRPLGKSQGSYECLLIPIDHKHNAKTLIGYLLGYHHTGPTDHLKKRIGMLKLPPKRNGRVLAWQVTQMCMADLTYPSLLQHQIVTMAAAPPNNLVTTECDNLLYLTAIQRDAIMNNGWAHLTDFQGFNYDRIQTWAR